MQDTAHEALFAYVPAPITDESPTAPDQETLDKAANALSAEFPQADVSRYFWTLLWQDPETWGGLKDRPELHAQ